MIILLKPWEEWISFLSWGERMVKKDLGNLGQKERYSEIKKELEKGLIEDRIKICIKIIKKYSKENERILDIGCGNGYVSKIFKKELKLETFGCDQNKEMLKEAKKEGIKTKFFDFNKKTKLPYRSNFFDFVFAGEIIEHLIDTDKFLEEIKRVLKKKGYVLITTPNLSSLENIIRAILGIQLKYVEYKKPKNAGIGHVKMYTLKTLKKQLKEKSFDIVLYKGCHLHYSKEWYKLLIHLPFKTIGHLVPNYARGIIILARKNEE